MALVEQIEAGHGYTLQGHPVLKEQKLVEEQYGRELFFHPPGGVALFWLGHQVAGERGYPLVQVASYALFFWSVMWLGTLVLRPFSALAGVVLALLAAVTPIMAFVAGRFWLDGPLLAFSTLAAAVFVRAALAERLGLVALAGAILGYALLIKLTAALIVPGAVALVWALRPRGAARRPLVTAVLVFVGVAFLVQLPWEIWQWHVVGSPFPVWAGRPAARLVQTNPFVYYLTVVRTPWTYLELLPQVTWTLVPALLLLVAARRIGNVGRAGIALLVWVAGVVVPHMILGAMGYSKFLRYVVLVTPGTVLLFASAFSGVVELARGRRKLTMGIVLLLTLGLAGFGLEVVQGLRTSLYDNARLDLIRPLFGLRGVED